MRRFLRVLGWSFAVIISAIVALIYFLIPFSFWGMPFNHTRHTHVPVTPAWALECWLWEDDVNTADYVWELLDGYREHDIPVRTILIDSPWSMRYNDFIVDEARYPDPAQFFGELEAQGYRVVLWMTSLVNSRNPDTAIQDSTDWFEEAKAKGYLAADGEQTRWWKGTGGFIDYTNPEAMVWWRGLQQQVFDWGVDGWKLDGGATLFGMPVDGLPLPLPFNRTHAGWMTTRKYMDHYYRDEYQHGLTQNPEFITMSRSLDSPLPWAHPEGFAPLDASPVNWVGDNRHTWDYETRGLERAIHLILRSAKIGYNVVGSDIGGYHGGMPIPPDLYIRWAQFSTFCGFFLNGGHGERRMWERSEQELAIIRTFSWLRTELVPYIYTQAANHALGDAPTLMRPMGVEYQYYFGDNLLVAPIYQDSLTRTVRLPEGSWRYWFDDGEVIEGPQTFTRDFPMDEYPVYLREGSIFPMNVSRDYTGFGGRDSEGYMTWVVYPAESGGFTLLHAGSADRDGRATPREDAGRDARTTTGLHGETHLNYTRGEHLEIRLSGVKQPHILRIKSPESPTEIRLDGVPLPTTQWTHDTTNGWLIIKTDAYDIGLYRIVF